MKTHKGILLLTLCLWILLIAGCSKNEEAPQKSDNAQVSVSLAGSYHSQNNGITIQITDDNRIIFQEEKQGNVKKLMEELIKEKMQAEPQDGFMEDLVEGLTSGCEFTRTDTQLTFFPVVDDGFSLEVKYFYDGTIAFLNESYVK